MSIWSGKSKYGKYKGEKGNPKQWRHAFEIAYKRKVVKKKTKK
jgi:hypothetical protein